MQRLSLLVSAKGTGRRSPCFKKFKPCLRRTFASSTQQQQQQPIQLHTEFIVDGNVTNDVSLVQQKAVSSIFLHGLLGTGKNLRMPAKKLTQVTNTAAIMMDLRGHGNSNHDDNTTITTIADCAKDVIYTLDKLNLTHDKSPKHVIGHSFGGRVALAYSHLLMTSNHNTTTNVQTPNHTWILDSAPGIAHSSVANVIQAIKSIPTPFQSKQDLIEILTTQHNIDKAIAMWMTTNLKRHPNGGFEFIFNLDTVEQVLQDFPKQDMLKIIQDVLFHDLNMEKKIHKIIAKRNDAWNSQLMETLYAMQSEVGNTGKQRELNLVSLDAGHWVHVDALDSLLEHMLKEF
ncbi:hypothetical protein CTEN210_09174 [Chaetoceros tenuissimus]|uniref:AB hydrolase-1 domain-containing protein n=1 Tax=Chaetoceros tenuissimus TaxID=426638 RepID=A0AAD3H7C4_9STRA|nr:hypothetical protein CTEN210_09174 [Chaetoceros tenuissimus]